MSTFLVNYNGTDLTAAGLGLSVSCAFRPDGIDAPADLAQQDVPRRQGSVVQAARKKSRVIRIIGQVGGASCTPDDLKAALDIVRAATAPLTGPQALYAGSDDRYWLAQRASYTESYQQGLMYGSLADVQIGFSADDPDAYGSGGLPSLTPVTDTVTLGVSGATNVTPAGNSATYPVWTLTISATAAGTISVANALSGETLDIAGSFTSGDVLVFDSRPATYGATWNGSADYGIFTGPIPILWPGTNAITITLATLALSAASVTYAPRYS